DNLFVLIDWNDFGIDDNRLCDTVHGTPVDWFAPYGWRVEGTEQGSHFPSVAAVLERLVEGENPQRVPSIGWFKTRKGRGYGVYDNKSHGSPHPPNSSPYWETKRPFQEKYGVQFVGYGEPAPGNEEDFRRQTLDNLLIVSEVLHRDEELCQYLAETLADLGDRVTLKIPSCQVGKDRNPYHDPRLFDFAHYPSELFAKPGEKAPNRAALAKFGAWVNAFGAKEYDRPLFIACSADLAESTNIAGFAKKWGDFAGYGAFSSCTNPQGVLLPQEITEFANAGIMAGLTSVNLAEDPFREFDGFWGACSTYGSFAYLKYGMMRLFSQMAQDCPLKVGKVIWVAGHSGPETADDSRTHFGIFEPGVTQLFPKGQVLNLHPWEHNEVPVVLGAALATEVPIIVLHLTRPPIAIPDREKLGIPSHFEAARGAYLIRDFHSGAAPMGTIIVQGTSTTDEVIRCLPLLRHAAAGCQEAGRQEGLNVRIVAAISHELFQRQDAAYREMILPWAGWLDSMVITSEALANMNDWISSAVARDYSLSSDWDNRWRTGGKLEEVLDEAHLTQPYLMAAIERFVRERPQRLARLRAVSL
ncbi:MAG: transketolase, partial [Coprothermobacterota bacterium]|nr:transketolase [Coprothermobacterota bacterium]